MAIEEQAAIYHLREALQDMVTVYPCPLSGLDGHESCHCPTCIAKHALSSTGGFKDKIEHS
jgi:hypothetical protein